jgi:hypothetical protein
MFDKQKHLNISVYNDKLKIGDLFKIDKDWPDYIPFKIGNCMFNNVDDVFMTKQNVFIVIKHDHQYMIDVYSLSHNNILRFGKTNYYFRTINVQSQ